MKKVNQSSRRLFALLLSIVMVLSTVIGTPGIMAKAAEGDTFIPVAVPNGDFESGETDWTFEGVSSGNDYGKVYSPIGSTTVNTTKVYEVCTKDSERTYKVSQTLKNLPAGTYKASIEAMGGNDSFQGSSHTTSFSAGGKTVALTPAQWNNWITYETDTFEVSDGSIKLEIASTLYKQYIVMDNVKLYRLDDGTGKTVKEVESVSKKIKIGSTFIAPEKVKVIFTDETTSNFNVVWDAAELAKVVTTTAAVFAVPGKAEVAGAKYDVNMTVTVVDSSSLIQTIPDDAAGAIDFNDNWKFYLATRTPVVNGSFAAGGVKDAGDYTTAQIISKDFEDSAWRTVDVPHDFSIEGDKTSKSVDAQAYLQGGLGYYRKVFTVPASMHEKKRIAVDFEGVYQNCIVYLNGEEIGGYPNGYTGFALDLTSKIVYGGENVLVVKVQNMSPSGRWYTGSGITRPVHLTVDNLASFNRNGITLSSPSLAEDYAKDKTGYLNIKADCYSDATNSNAYLKATVYDAAGNKVAEDQTERTAINPSTAFSLNITDLAIQNVNLWYPWNLGTPYLYKVKTELYTEVNGSADGYLLSDTEVTEYGFRWIEVKETTTDPNSGGLYVNGEYTKVQGVDLHHDSGALGAESYTDAYERQFDKLMDMGVNAYRTSHCPPSKQVIEVCRRKGILVVEEAYDGWGGAKATYDFGNFFYIPVPGNWAGLKPNGMTEVPAPAINYEGAVFTWSNWVIHEMVNRDKNEPSIFAWSIGNEIRGLGSKPAWYQPAKYDLLEISQTAMNEYTEAVRLRSEVDAADGSRLVLMGGDQERSVPAPANVWSYVNQVLDGYGLNYNTAKSVDGLTARFSIGDGTLKPKGSKTFFFESESSSQTSSRGVYLDPQFSLPGVNQTPGSRGGSNYDNDFASWTMSNEYGLKKDRDRKSFIGQFIWTGFDYLGEPTPYSVYPVGVASFGTIDTAGFPKDSFYLYQSQWIKKPMVHLLPTNWDDWREDEVVDVWVNTNAPSAELFLNGESLGRKSFDEKETAYGKKYYETSELVADDKTWGDEENPKGYTSKGAIVDEGEKNYGRLHLTWKVPYKSGKLEVKAYDKNNQVVAMDSVTTSSMPYTIQAEADKTVLAADGSSLSYIECTIVDKDGNMVADAGNLVNFDIEGAAAIVGVDNGQQESTELYKYGNIDKNTHSERTAYHGKVLVIVKSGKNAGDATLTITSDNLKTAQVALKVTADGTGTAPEQPVVVGTAASIDPVELNVPAVTGPAIGLPAVTGAAIELPAVVKVNYTSNAGDYSLLKAVTWNTFDYGSIEGTVEGVGQKAIAVITEKADMETTVELAKNPDLLGDNSIFDFADLASDSAAAKKALATATFTGGTGNYPNNMLDNNDATSWKNQYSRGASVLLDANSASRKSEYVEFYWKDANILNEVSLSFVISKACDIPSVLEVQYWNGAEWTKVKNQVITKAEVTKVPTVMQFTPVYTNKVRVYMENATPFSATGNIEITEASVKRALLKTAAGITLNQTEKELKVGEIQQLTAAVTPEDAFNKEVTYESSNPEVATVDKDGLVIALKDGTAEITATAIGGIGIKTMCKITVLKTEGPIVPAAGITLNPTTKELKVGETQQLTAVVTPENATNKVVTYESSSPEAVSVNASGLVTALKEGSAVITATAVSGVNVKATCTITVVKAEGPNVPATQITLTPSAKELKVGETQQLTAAVLPENATNKVVTYESSSPEAVSVNASGLVTALKEGSAVITATAVSGVNVKATCTITVVKSEGPNVPVTQITLTPSAKELKVGETKQMTAAVLPENATNKVVTYSSSNRAVATVKSGIVTAKSEGIAVITAKAKGGTDVTATCTITVVKADEPNVPVIGISLTPIFSELTIGQKQQLTAVVTPGNATNKVAHFTSSNPAVADVNDFGLVTAIKAGTAVITATADGGVDVMATSTIIVRNDEGTPNPNPNPNPTPTPTPSPAPSPSPSVPETEDDYNQVEVKIPSKVTEAKTGNDGLFYDKNGNILKETIVKTSDGAKYILNDTGAKYVSAIVTCTDDNRFIVDKSGEVIRGEIVTVNGKQYYTTKSSGKVVMEKLIKVDENKYYAAANGAFAKGKIISSGKDKYYTTKSTGKVVTEKLFKLNGNQYFADKSGKLAVSKWVTIDSKEYYFNAQGILEKTK